MDLGGDLPYRDAVWWLRAFNSDKEGCALFLYALARRFPDAPLLRDERFYTFFDFLEPPEDPVKTTGFLTLLKTTAVPPPHVKLGAWIDSARARGDAALTAERLALINIK